MTAQRPRTRDLDLWLVDKDAHGAVMPGPGVVYDRAGLGILVMDERGRDFTFTDTGHASRCGPVSGCACPPRWPVTSPPRSSGSRTTPRI
jgi:hypothetical protein